MTTAGNLPAKKIIHVVLSGGQQNKDAVVHCLNAAENEQMGSIAFPLLGAGNLSLLSIMQAFRGFILRIYQFVV